MYQWFLENFNRDKKEMIENKYIHCSFDSIEYRISRLKNINLDLLDKEDSDDIKWFYSVLIEQKPYYENVHDFYHKLIQWYVSQIKVVVDIVSSIEATDC